MGGSHLLQAIGKHDFTETTTPIPNCDGVATLQTVVCVTTIGHYVHPWQQVILPLPCPWCGLGHHPRYIRGAGAHLNHLVIHFFLHLLFLFPFFHSFFVLSLLPM